MADQDDGLSQINRSGFPFQLRVEDEIRATRSVHQWSVASREHAWASPGTSASGFIDLVLRHDQFSTFRLVLECKRNRANDARQLRWVFLIPEQKAEGTMLASCYEVEGQARAASSSTEQGERLWEELRGWDNVFLTPGSLQSEFCILQGDEPRNRPILEHLAAQVLESIVGLADEEVSIERSQNPTHLRLFIFPAIVTNAQIVVCRFDPNKINLRDGTLDMQDVELSIVPFIRFRKSMATSFPEGWFINLDSANKARERTVFVVNAESLTDFLKGWGVLPQSNDGYLIQRLMRQRLK